MELSSFKTRIEEARFEADSCWLDAGSEDDFDDITLLATQVCNTFAAAVLLIENEKTLAVIAIGLSATEQNWPLPLNTVEPLIIAETSIDDRFDNRLQLENGKSVRFYASVKVVTPQNFPSAYLCVLDSQPQNFSKKQCSGLQLLGKQLSSVINLKTQNIILKKNEEEFRSSEEEMSSIFQNAIDAVIVVDSDGLIQQWNPKAEIIFGWTADEVKGKEFPDVILPKQFHEEHRKIIEGYEQSENEEFSNTVVEVSALRKDHSEFDIALGISPAIIRNRRFYICFVSDITDRKMVTEQLDKQKEFYENILNSIPSDIAVFDANHKYLFVNPGAISVKELRNYIIGKDDYEYAAYRNRDASVADARRAMFLQVKNGGKEIRWEDNIKTPNGTVMTSLRRMFPVFDEHGELSMVIGFGLDITERKLLEEKQSTMVRQLSVQNTQLVDFCNIVSHNLRAPLVNMSMLADFIEESDDPEERCLLISKLKPVIENLHTTFNELVESIQIKQNLEIETEQVCLKDCLNRTLQNLGSIIIKSEANIEADFTDAPSINFPPKYAYSIFHNLLSNSLKYQSPKRKPVIKLHSERVDGNILFSISDNGLGIDLAKHKDNFFKIGKVFHKHPDAKGFGLYMTKTQLEAMNSKIWVESVPDSGTTFFISFTNQEA